MAKAVISYDRDLPEISGRRPWEKPTSYLIKDNSVPTGWREEKEERRPSKLLLISKMRDAVGQWREDSYPNASEVTKRLFEYWFEEDHEVEGLSIPFRYHFCQREAIETLVYLVEIKGFKGTQQLIRDFASVFKKDLFEDSVTFQETMDGRHQLRRYVPELEKEGVQDLPPKDLGRYAFKMATGSGKTWVMAMAIVWAHFHKKLIPGSTLSANFLVVAPNIIVYQRLEKDFGNNKIFYELPLIPSEWRASWNQKVILRGESGEPNSSGTLFVTNIHQIHESRSEEWTPANAVEALLGQKPNKDLSSYQRPMLDRLKGLKDLIVLNDEAHHVHDEDLAWSQALLNVHTALPKGLSLWLDFSATPKDQNGMYFPWTIVDYPLAQAVEDRIVKAPIIVTKEDDSKQPSQDPDHISSENLIEKFGYWIQAAVQRWNDHHKTYKKLGTKPVLFIMVEKNVYADTLGQYLWKTTELGFKESEVLIIHTDNTGEITKNDIEKVREAARDIDRPESKIKVIVSVMMLREGWDVRNVSVVLGLRPYTAKAEILPEQVIGRGLRLMTGIGPDVQTLEVLGTRNLLKVLRDQLEAEGVGVSSTKNDPPPPIIIEPLKNRAEYDIAIPLTKPNLSHDIRKLSNLDPSTLDTIYDQEELEEAVRIILRMEFATTETPIHQADLAASSVPIVQELLASITNKVAQRANLTNIFSQLFPIVRNYVSNRCFGKTVDLDSDSIRSCLHRVDLQEGISKYLARKIGELTVEKRAIEFEKADFKLSDTKAFSWRRNLPPMTAKKTIFNYVATYNPLERRFAEFLDKAKDVVRFASLGTTEQGDSGTQFRVDYLKLSGAIGFYHPDWVVIQKTSAGEVNWIIETKGRVWEGTEAKDAAIRDWCARVSESTGQPWQYVRINQAEFEAKSASTLAEALEHHGATTKDLL